MTVGVVVIALLAWCLLAVVLAFGLGALVARNASTSAASTRTASPRALGTPAARTAARGSRSGHRVGAHA